jgi:hypothetical protein
VPFGLGGDIVLNNASCEQCAKETGRLEQRLLRGHWWGYRQRLNLKSRSSKGEVPDLSVKIKRLDGTQINANLPMASNSVVIFAEFDSPSILAGIMRDDIPFAPRVYAKILSEFPREVKIDEKN